ncbi:hypothetical protein N2152v2_003146 [Parachlorella kessleri]
MPSSAFTSFLRGAKAFSRKPAALIFGATAIGAGVWIAQSEWRRPHRGLSTALPDTATPRSSLSTAATSDDSAEAAATRQQTTYVPRLLLATGAAMIPHPAKQEKGGEDAYFIAEHCLGVADGVGGWAEIGVDPGLYSRQLMDFAKEATANCPPGPNAPQHLLEVAYLSTTARGSSTACILCLENERLHASNLGDSGFMVVRSGELVFMSPQQQHEFNFPYQIGSADSMADTPHAAQRFTVDVHEGDIIVAATDGLFDNVYPDEAAALVTASKKRGDSPDAAAAALAQYARLKAVDPTHLSPFAYGAQQLGYRFFGGKLDDITVVCAYVKKPSTGP